MPDYILYLFISGALQVVISDIPYGECNLLSDEIFERAEFGWYLICEPITGLWT